MVSDYKPRDNKFRAPMFKEANIYLTATTMNLELLS